MSDARPCVGDAIARLPMRPCRCRIGAGKARAWLVALVQRGAAQLDDARDEAEQGAKVARLGDGRGLQSCPCCGTAARNLTGPQGYRLASAARPRYRPILPDP